MTDRVIDAEREQYARDVEQNIAEIYQSAKVQTRRMASRYHPELQPVGYGILRWVFEGPKRSIDIAQHLGMDKGAVSRQIAQLKEFGLVETRPDPEDGRAMLVAASPRALEVRDQFRRETTSGYGRLFADWTTEDIAVFGRLLMRFNESMGVFARK